MTDRPLQQNNLEALPSNPATLVRAALEEAGYIISEYSRLARDLDVREEAGEIYIASFFDEEQKPHRIRLKYNPDTQSMEIIKQPKLDMVEGDQDVLRKRLEYLVVNSDPVDEAKLANIKFIPMDWSDSPEKPLSETEQLYDVGYISKGVQFIQLLVGYNNDNEEMRIIKEIMRMDVGGFAVG